MALDPQYAGSGGGLYPASSQSQIPGPVGANKLEGVPAASNVGVDATLQLRTPGLQSPVSGDWRLASGTGTLLTDWQSNGALSLVSSNGGGEAAALDPSTLCDGQPMLKCTCGSAGTYIADFLFTSPVYLAQLRSLQIPIRWSSNSLGPFVGSSNSVQIWLYDDATGTRQWRTGASLRALDAAEMRPGVTHVVSMAPGANSQGWSFGGTSAPTATTDLDSYQVARLRVVFVVPASMAGEAVWLGSIRANGRARPCVSVILDGQYDSQHKYILPMLEAYGLKASLALQHSQIGQSGRMTDAQIDRAYQWGHETIHHTYGAPTTGYQDAALWPDAASITADIQAGQAYQTARGWTRGLGYGVHGFTHPYSSTVAAARQALVTSSYQAAGIKALRRGNNVASSTWFDRCQSVARPACVDPYSIQGALQITNSHNAASVTGQIGRAERNGEWAIFTVHRSVVATPGSLEMLNSDFLTWIDSLGADVAAGKIDVRPFSEACRYYGITS